MVRNDGNNSVRLRAWAASAALLLLACLWPMPANAGGALPTKPRTIVTTDGGSDDKCSFVRFLLYTTDFDIAALIYTNSRWRRPGGAARQYSFVDISQNNHQTGQTHWDNMHIARRLVADTLLEHGRNKYDVSDTPLFVHILSK
jgi:hypothetical protein